jgi:hypothetical protein
VRRCEDNNKMVLIEIQCESVACIKMAEIRVQCRENNNEIWLSIKGLTFLDQLRDYQLLKKNPVIGSHFVMDLIVACLPTRR